MWRKGAEVPRLKRLRIAVLAKLGSQAPWTVPGRREWPGSVAQKRSSQPKTSEYQKIEFLGFRIQWFSSGK